MVDFDLPVRLRLVMTGMIALVATGTWVFLQFAQQASNPTFKLIALLIAGVGWLGTLFDVWHGGIE